MIGNPRAYLYRSLKNYWIKPWSPRRRRQPSPTDRNLDLFITAASPGPPEWFWEIVDGPDFPPECAEVIRLRLDRETGGVLLTFEEIGADLGITRDTASRRYARGMDIIRRLLEDDDT